MIKNYYEILDVKITSSQEEIKSAFRKLAIFWHPDRNSNPIALQKMQAINEAYEILSNRIKKETYDKLYKEFFNFIFVVVPYSNSQNQENSNEKQNEAYKQREDFIKKKYEKEFNELNNWIKNIKFSLGAFDRFLDKSLAKVDKPIENFVYYFPVVLGIIFLIIILITFLSK